MLRRLLAPTLSMLVVFVVARAARADLAVPPPPPPPPLPGQAAPVLPQSLQAAPTLEPLVLPVTEPAPVVLVRSEPLVTEDVPVAAPAATPCEPCTTPTGWKHKVGFTLNVADGNDEYWNVNAEGTSRYEGEEFALEVAARFVYAEQDGDRSAETWYGKLRGERKLDSCRYLFGQLTYDRDQPAGLDTRLTALVGYGMTLIDSGGHLLKGEIGGGGTFEQREGRDERFDPSAYAGLDYERCWGDGSKLTAALDFVPNLGDFDLSVVRLDVDYVRPISGCLSLNVGLLLEYVVDPPDAESLDILLGVGLAITW